MITAQELAIVRLFFDNVYGRSPDILDANQNHDGAVGHWLETQMGISHNAHNGADLLGYEMKNHTSSKTSFGDWSADFYLFKCRNNPTSTLERNRFMEIFGKPNPKKDNRFSWSGSAIPKVDNFSPWNGSRMIIDGYGNILIIYDYSKDPRVNKSQIVPVELQKEGLVLASWSRDLLKNRLTEKFSKNGWFKCYQNPMGVYDQIAFGEPMDFDNWLYLVKQGVVFFDSGMYVGNSRNYSQWRANNSYWESLIVRRYPPFPFT